MARLIPHSFEIQRSLESLSLSLSVTVIWRCPLSLRNRNVEVARYINAGGKGMKAGVWITAHYDLINSRCVENCVESIVYAGIDHCIGDKLSACLACRIFAGPRDQQQ